MLEKIETIDTNEGTKQEAKTRQYIECAAAACVAYGCDGFDFSKYRNEGQH